MNKISNRIKNLFCIDELKNDDVPMYGSDFNKIFFIDNRKFFSAQKNDSGNFYLPMQNMIFDNQILKLIGVACQNAGNDTLDMKYNSVVLNAEIFKKHSEDNINYIFLQFASDPNSINLIDCKFVSPNFIYFIPQPNCFGCFARKCNNIYGVFCASDSILEIPLV